MTKRGYTLGKELRHAESEIQQVCVFWFRHQYPQYALNLFAVPNGGGRSALEAAIMKGEGVTAGVADVLLLVPSGEYHGLCIEFKKKAYKYVGEKVKLVVTNQSAPQKEWQKAVEPVGYKYVVVRSLQEFIELINNYLAPNN